MQCGFTQLFSGLLPLLFGKMPLEIYRLFKVKCLEVFVLGIDFKPRQRLGERINRLLAVTLGFLQIGEILVLDSYVVGIVCCHVFAPYLKLLFTLGWLLSTNRCSGCVADYFTIGWHTWFCCAASFVLAAAGDHVAVLHDFDSVGENLVYPQVW